MLYYADVSRLSFIMLGLFSACSLYIGLLTYRVANKTINSKNMAKQLDIPRWFAARFPMLGILGTGIGITYMIYNVDFMLEVKYIIPTVLSGLGTALLTTITGIICCYITEFQILNLTHGVLNGKKNRL